MIASGRTMMRVGAGAAMTLVAAAAAWPPAATEPPDWANARTEPPPCITTSPCDLAPPPIESIPVVVVAPTDERVEATAPRPHEVTFRAVDATGCALTGVGLAVVRHELAPDGTISTRPVAIGATAGSPPVLRVARARLQQLCSQPDWQLGTHPANQPGSPPDSPLGSRLGSQLDSRVGNRRLRRGELLVRPLAVGGGPWTVRVPAEPQGPVDVTVPTTVRVAVRVRYRNGIPCRGATLQLAGTEPAGAGGPTSGASDDPAGFAQRSRRATTNADGEAVFADVVAGAACRLHAQFGADQVEQQITASHLAAAEAITLVLPHDPRTLRGEALSATGQPLATQPLQLRCADPDIDLRTTTDSAGRFTFLLPPALPLTDVRLWLLLADLPIQASSLPDLPADADAHALGVVHFGVPAVIARGRLLPHADAPVANVALRVEQSDDGVRWRPFRDATVAFPSIDGFEVRGPAAGAWLRIAVVHDDLVRRPVVFARGASDVRLPLEPACTLRAALATPPGTLPVLRRIDSGTLAEPSCRRVKQGAIEFTWRHLAAGVYSLVLIDSATWSRSLELGPVRVDRVDTTFAWPGR